MAIPTRVGSTTAKQSGSTAVTIDISGIATDSYMVAWVTEGNTTTAITLPTGWDIKAGPLTVGSRRYWCIARKKVDGDTFSITKSGSVVVEVLMHWGAGADPNADWQVGTPFARSSGTSADDQYAQAPSITTGEADMLVFAAFIEATSAEDTTVQSLTGSGWTLLAKLDDQASPDTTFIEQILVAYKEMPSAGATGTPQVNYQNAQNINAGGMQIGLTPAAPSNVGPTAMFSVTEQNWLHVEVDGSASTDPDGTVTIWNWLWGDGSSTGSSVTASHDYAEPGTYTITLQAYDDDMVMDTHQIEITVEASPMVWRNGIPGRAFYRNGKKGIAMYRNGILLKRWGFTVADMLAMDEIQVAWRGLGDVYSEMCLPGYAAAVDAGFKVLECSIHYSSDGVPVLIHDDTVDRVTNGTGTVISKTWATLQALTVDAGTGGTQLQRLETVLDLYADTHVIFIDDKSNGNVLNGNTAALLALLETYPNPQQHFVWKGFRGWSPAADLWTAEGYEAWGIYYDTDSGVMGTVGSPHSSVSHFTMLGLNWDAAQTPHWDNAVAIAAAQNKRLLAHVIHSTSNANTARSKGADGLMTGVIP